MRNPTLLPLLSLASLAALAFLTACGDKDDDAAAAAPEACADGSAPATWYPDLDGDGFAGEDFAVEACEQPEGYLDSPSDCDDLRADAAPGLEETCDGIDNDCDGVIDEGDSPEARTFYVDSDGDGFGAEGSEFEACGEPEAASEIAGDCDDSDAAVHPGAEEQCNSVDDDCDGEVDSPWSIPGTYDEVQDAVDEAPDGALVCVEAGTYEVSDVQLVGDIAFAAVEGQEVVFRGSGTDRMFEDGDWTGPALSISGIDLENLGGAMNAGALFHGGYGSELTLRDLEIRDADFSSYYLYGGLIQADQGSVVTLEDVVVRDLKHEHSSSYGYLYGALASVQGDLVVRGLRVEDIELEGGPWGGLFYSEGGRVHLEDVEVSDVHIESTSGGGGVLLYHYGYGADVTLTDVSMHDNTLSFGSSSGYLYGFLAYVEDYGTGGVQLQRVSVVDNEVSGASLTVYGGLLHSYFGDLQLDNIVFADNTFEGSGSVQGGLIYAAYGSVALRNADVAYNRFEGAHQVWGGLYYDDEFADLQVRNLNFVGNEFDEASAEGELWYAAEEGREDGLDWAYSNVYDNRFEDPGHEFSVDGEELDGVDSLSVDPLYESSTDLRLAEGSPLIDAGDPELSDVDGSTSDIGAYGGPHGSW